MAPRLGSSSSGGGLFTCHWNTEKIYIALGIAAIIWIGGILTMIGVGRSGSLSHPTGPHSHNSDLSPRGYTDVHAIALHGAPDTDAATAGGSHSHTRGSGLSKMDALQREIQMGLHNLFHHDEDEHWHGPSNRYGEAAKIESDTTAAADGAATPASATAAIESDTPRAPPTSISAMPNPAIVILTYKRRQYLLRTLDSIVATPGVDKFTLYVSQDGSSPDLSDLPAKYAPSHPLILLNHPRVALMVADQSATAYLAQHYKWVLDRLFLHEKHSHVVIMEDDMIVSPDFLTMFQETASLLDSDPTLMCVSSWNDNGMSRLVADPSRLMRTDYFPGLGWMTNAAIWSELSPNFPLDQWDHWMRLDTTHRGRDCLIPEVARNHNIGEEGTNMGQNFYQRFLAPIAFNQVPTSVLKLNPKTGLHDLEHMRSAVFETDLQDRMTKSIMLGRFGSNEVTTKLATFAGLQATIPEVDSYVILFEREQYMMIASQFGLIDVPRSIHKGVITIRQGPHLLYFADIKSCPYLSAADRFQRNPTLTPATSRQSESCTSACRRNGLECAVSHFQYLNQCSELRKKFDCLKGCRGGVAGQDVPNYVDNRDKPELYGFCLTTENASTCDAAHWSASRLCPCVKKP